MSVKKEYSKQTHKYTLKKGMNLNIKHTEFKKKERKRERERDKPSDKYKSSQCKPNFE